MIKTGEIDRIAIREGVRATQVQKDYVITWILWGISRSEFLNNNIVFKGGTCLKKIYYEDYRYSEDMDFTLVDDSVDNEKIIQNFKLLFKEVYDASRIKMEVEKNTFEIHKTSGSVKFKIRFTGPHGQDTIKMDLTRSEIIIFPVELKSIFNIYSDIGLEEEIHINTYSIKELFIEKVTALMGRTIPRDLYDFYYLTEIEKIELADVYIEFMIKAKNKGHHPVEFSKKVTPKKNTFNRDWEENLARQMKKGELPDFKEVWRKVNQKFNTLATLMKN